MRLVKQENDGCVYAALSMVLNEELEVIYHCFKHWPFKHNFPFPGEWAQTPRVPSMEEICDIAWRHFNTALVPFPRDPLATPHAACPPIHVWENSDAKFFNQLRLGRGLIEGVLSSGRGHMVAWDGTVVFDPRDYCYTINVADRFNFEPRRFWLAVGRA